MARLVVSLAGLTGLLVVSLGSADRCGLLLRDSAHARDLVLLILFFDLAAVSSYSADQWHAYGAGRGGHPYLPAGAATTARRRRGA